MTVPSLCRIELRMTQLADMTAVIMAKYPKPGLVKSRLIGAWLDADRAAGIALAMLRCIVLRCEIVIGRTVLAVSPDGFGDKLGIRLNRPDLSIIDQGAGDLGQRMLSVWQRVGPSHPVAFFGMDSPDVPSEHLRQIPLRLAESDVALGPTGDGGYWTLAARTCQPSLLRKIDWGGDSVYDQTCRRALQSHLSLACLPSWDDVDDEDDLKALCRRLACLRDAPDPEIEPLMELSRRLTELTA